MTRHQRTARACLAGTVLATSTTALATAAGYPGLCPIPVLAAFLCAEQAYRSYREHHRVLVAHELARRAALGNRQPSPQPAPCCQFWRHSDGAVHDPRHCTRPAAARYDGAPLGQQERAAFAEITSHYDHGNAA